KEKGKQLFERLVTYRRNILAIDSIIYQGINDLSFIEAGSLVSQNKKEEFVDLYFKKTSHKGINALLTNFSSNIKQNEYKIILLFREQWSGYFMENFIQYSTLIGQNSTHIRKGEKIEIIAGLGSFNIQIIPTITIDNKLMKLNDYGAAVYTKIPKKNSGKLSIPVVIEFVDKYGAKQKIKKLVEFVVDN
ncbi:MAG: hypothetical protein ACXWV9_01725, partial [Flavisolibacter sp.]